MEFNNKIHPISDTVSNSGNNHKVIIYTKVDNTVVNI